MTDLHERLTSAVRLRRQQAEAATPGPWEHVDYASPEGQPMTKDGLPSTFKGCGSVITINRDLAGGDIAAPNGDLYPRGGYSPDRDMAFIAANDPATVLRRCERDKKVLERHKSWSRLVGLDPRPRTECFGCEAVWPCIEILDLAAEFGITEGAEE